MSERLGRREFFWDCARAAGTMGIVSEMGARRAAAEDVSPGPVSGEASLNPVEARHYKKLDERRVQCGICPRKCTVADLERGTCGVRENRGGTYYFLVHSRACSVHTDPVEKKPFFHFLPGTQAFSLATAGCNIECKFCQNWQIAQFRPEQVQSIYLPPDAVQRAARQQGAATVAYTYSEPVVFFEYMYDTAAAARQNGLRNVMISNGYINEDPLRELLGVLDAVKIDFKSFRESFYKETCSGELKPVLDTLVSLKKSGKWFELVVLVVPTLNDSEAEFRDMSRWIVANLGKDVPVHFTRFHPDYRLRNLPSTPTTTLERAREIARSEGMHFAYVGNVPGHPFETTYCFSCTRPLIRRVGFMILENALANGRCPSCKTVIPGVWA
ncbi:MAG: AmmeMemoRadiSam system radical SAM enzyme [Acidobacteriota bacterium]